MYTLRRASLLLFSLFSFFTYSCPLSRARARNRDAQSQLCVLTYGRVRFGHCEQQTRTLCNTESRSFPIQHGVGIREPTAPRDMRRVRVHACTYTFMRTCARTVAASSRAKRLSVQESLDVRISLDSLPSCGSTPRTVSLDHAERTSFAFAKWLVA